MLCGIYKLTFNGTNKVYIGQSIDIHKRYQKHIRQMINGEHTKKMLAAYDKYGLPNIEVLLECDKSELDENENLAIEIYDSVANGFNDVNKAGELPNPSKYSHFRSSKYTEEQILLAATLLQDKTIPILKVSELSDVDKYTVYDIAKLRSFKNYLRVNHQSIFNNLANLLPEHNMSGKSRHTW